ncbi:MAG: DUF4446 family protein [Cellulosilyticaceae bacterium]
MMEPYMGYIVIGLGIFCLILFVLLLVSLSKFKKVQRKYETFMTKDDVDLENLLIHYAKKVNHVKEKEGEILEEINKLSNQLKYCTQKVGIVRYNAIENVGAELSFAIAMMDAENNGIILNGIYSRDGSYIYSKPVKAGQSTYKLSEEEKEAIRLAQENNQVI